MTGDLSSQPAPGAILSLKFAQNRVGGLEMSALETGVVICEKQSGIIIVALHKRQFAKWKEATIRYKQAL